MHYLAELASDKVNGIRLLSLSRKDVLNDAFSFSRKWERHRLSEGCQVSLDTLIEVMLQSEDR